MPIGIGSDIACARAAADLGRDGFVVLNAGLGPSQLVLLRSIAAAIALDRRADYPDADVDVGFATEVTHLRAVLEESAAFPLLRRCLGPAPTFVTAWQRVARPGSAGGVWHQDLQREFWPPALNVAVYLDAATATNGPTLVVPGTHVLPHPEFDRRPQPHETAVIAPAGGLAVFYPTTWHRGAANSTDRERRALFCYYRRADAVCLRRTADPPAGHGWTLDPASGPG